LEGGLAVAVTIIIVIASLVLFSATYKGPFISTPTVQATSTSAAQATLKPDPYFPGTPMIVRDFIPGKSILDETWDTNGHCHNEDTKYHTFEQTHSFYPCFARHNYANFVFEATMTIATGIGTRGGIILRADNIQGKFYTYDFGLNGDFTLWYYPDPSARNSTPLASGSAQNFFHTGLNAANTLAIVANGRIFDLYVNYKKIKTVLVPSNLLYTQGQLGVYAYSTGNDAAQVFYSDLTIWRIS
jgi:hypothetical protein